MVILDIVLYPDPILRTKCKPVEHFDAKLATLVDSLVETMYFHRGTIGLAAPQINVDKRVVAIDINAKTTKDKLLVLINPIIIEATKKKYVREGCLSLPNYLADIKRAQKITIKAQDVHGNEFEYATTNFEAVAIQHEIDHLDGILFIDKVDSIKTDLIRRQAININKEAE